MEENKNERLAEPQQNDGHPEQQPYSDPNDDYAIGMQPIEETDIEPRMKHSGPGIASFILAILAIVVTVISFSMIINIGLNLVEQFDLQNPNFFEDTGNVNQFLSDYPQIPIIFLSLVSVFGMIVIGSILGIVGLVIRNRKRVFAVIGTIINMFGLAIVFFMFLIGISLG